MSAPKDEAPRVVVTEAVEWLRAISTWLLETDNDMKLPNGILDTNPLDIADALTAAEAASREEVARLREALERMVYETTHLSPMKPNGDHDCTIKAEALAIARAALTPATGGEGA